MDIATSYTSRRKAFGQVIAQFEGVSFQIAEAFMLLDAPGRWGTPRRGPLTRGSHAPHPAHGVRVEKFITESCQKAVHNAMQVVGGIGYTTIFPIERIFRDVRLASSGPERAR